MAKLSWKIWLMIIFLVLSLVAISPTGFFSKGVIITSVSQNLTEQTELYAGEILLKINDYEIDSLEDYNIAISEVFSTEGEKKITIKIVEKNNYFKK